MDKIEELLTRGVANIIPGKDKTRELLESGKKLNIFLGIDPTATRIHLGHAVPLRKLQAFAELGHNVRFLIGDFTALIGDTSDKDTERPVLTSEQIQENFQNYKRQAEKIVDFSLPNVTVVHNSDWLSKLSFEEIVRLCQHFSVGDFVGRELIRKRLQDNKRVGLHEFLYPVMQGYDSYFMDTDIQIGGTDQTFNMQAGRTLQNDIREKESFVLATEFLIGTDGRKMSKSWGNAIWLEDTPEEMYTKVMAIHDDVIVEYFKLATNVSMEKVQEVAKRLENGENPRDLKKELAITLITELYDEEAARRGEEAFQKIVVHKDLEAVSTTLELLPLVDVVARIAKEGVLLSKSEAKRLIEQGGVEVNGEKETNPNRAFEKGNYKVKVGKFRLVDVTFN